MGIHGMDVSQAAKKPPILMADNVAANRNNRVDDATYARNALTAARDAARFVCGHTNSVDESYMFTTKIARR